MKNHQLTCKNEQLTQRILALETQLSEQKIVLDDKDKSLLKKDSLIGQKSAKITTLEEYIRYMTQQRFGASSEKWSADQLGLFDEAELLSNEDETEQTCIEVPTHQRKKNACQFLRIYRQLILFMTYLKMKNSVPMTTKP